MSAREPTSGSPPIRPFQWAELRDEAPAPAPRGAAPAAAAPEPAGPTPADLLEEARREAAALLAQARDEAEALRAEAHRQGLAAGTAEGRAALEAAAGRWVAAAEELAGFKPRLYEEARAQVVELSLALLRKLLGPLAEDDAGVVAAVAGRALQILTDREVVTLRVNPEDLQNLLDAKPRLLQTFDGIKKLTVLEDPSVGRGGCLVETPTAEIDARLDAQLQELARALRKP